MAHSVGLLNGFPIEFELAEDVLDGANFAPSPPPLLELLRKSREMFSMPEASIALESVILVLALMTITDIVRSVALCGAR